MVRRTPGGAVVTAPEFVLPAAMVEAAMKAIHDVDCDAWCDYEPSVEGRYGRSAVAALNAALAGCEVREEWAAYWPERPGEDGATCTGWLDSPQEARDRRGDPNRTDGVIRQRFVITTRTEEEVPDGQS